MKRPWIEVYKASPEFGVAPSQVPGRTKRCRSARELFARSIKSELDAEVEDRLDATQTEGDDLSSTRLQLRTTILNQRWEAVEPNEKQRLQDLGRKEEAATVKE